MTFTGLDGWPCGFAESAICAALMAAISGLPGADMLPQETLQTHAFRLFSASEQGRAEDEPSNQKASTKQSEAQLRDLDRLASELERGLRDLKQPAFDALHREGANIAALSQTLAQLREYAGHAFFDLRAAEHARGRPPNHEASAITTKARCTFETITQRRATFTTDPANGQVSGAWPDFLKAVFTALAVDASVASQVRRKVN